MPDTEVRLQALCRYAGMLARDAETGRLPEGWRCTWDVAEVASA